MAADFVAGTSQLRFLPFNPQGSQQLRAGFAGEMFQVTAQGGTTLLICNISDGQPRGDHTEPWIEGREFAQERLKRRLT